MADGMSYDVSLVDPWQPPCPTCGRDFERHDDVFWRNHTSNTSRMWREAGCDLAEFHGKTTEELAGPLEAAITRMKATPELYKQWNAPNGWGDYDSTLSFLEDIWKACRENPEAIVEVSR